MTSEQLSKLVLASHENYSATFGGQPFLQPQLEMYAEDFQEILGRYNALERRHENLKVLHSRLSEAGETSACLTNSSKELYLVMGANGHIKFACDSARSVFMMDECKVGWLHQLMAPFHLTHLAMLLKGMVDGNHDFASGQTEFILHPGGDPARARLFVTSFLPLSDGLDAQTCWIIRDLSSERSLSPDPRRQLEFYKNVYQGVMAVDCQGQIIAVDAVFSTITGYANEDVRRQMPVMLKASNGNPIFQDVLWSELKINGRWYGEITTIKKIDQPLRQWLSITAVKDQALQTAAYIAVFADKALMTVAERPVLDTACHDAMTGLPNFSLFQDRVSQKIAAAWRGNSSVALLSIGLDRFQYLEGTQDSAGAETVLQTIGARLQEMIRGCDIITNTAPDHFFVLLVGALDKAAVAAIASRMISVLSMPIPAKKQKRVIGVSIGCALFPGDGMDTLALLNKAEAAMLLARKNGGNRYRLFSEKISQSLMVPPSAVEHEFAEALHKKELYLAYQPLVASDGNCQLLACEVQLRWQHAWLGDLAWSERGAPVKVGDSDVDAGVWMLKTACRELESWRVIGISEMNLVINLTAGQISSHRMVEALTEVLAETRIDPGRLELTLTEAKNLTIHDINLDNVSRLRAMGVQIVLRNFGTWYVRLTQFKSRPFDRLKIERSFEHDAAPEKIHGAAWEWVIGMGVSTRLDLISHNRADMPQIDLLTPRHGHLTQGYLKGRPMPSSAFLYWAFEEGHLPHEPETWGYGA
jgi:diguanylate cyclase (GGDEF)-like protein